MKLISVQVNTAPVGLDLDTIIEYDTEVMSAPDTMKNENNDHRRKQNPIDRWIDSIQNPVLRELMEWLEMLVVAAVIAILFNSFIIANSTIPTGSMETTINAGDRVVGWRLSYTFGEPERGDVAIFKYGWKCFLCKEEGENPAPEVCPNCGKSLKFHQTIYYVKRVIGLPGDVVEIRAEGSCTQDKIESDVKSMFKEGDNRELMTAAVYVNGEKLEEPYLREPMLYTGDITFEVPEDSYLMLGDNRNCSRDARYWANSYIPKERMIAKVLFRYWKKISLIK